MNIVTNIQSVAKKINYFITRTPAAGMIVLEDTANRIRARLNVRQPVQYPIRWDSAKQRAAFFATNGFGNGIPYERTGNTVWTVSRPYQNEVNLFASHPAGPVFGLMPDGSFWQSSIHRGTWPYLRDVLLDEMSRIPRQLAKAITTIYNEASG